VGKRYAQVVRATPGLVNYWRMTSPTSDPAMVGSLALPHTGSPAAAGSLVLDPSDSARSYSGSGQYSSVASGWAAGLSALSIECWFREAALVDWAWIIGQDAWPTARCQLLRRASESNLIIGYRDPVVGTDYGGVGPYAPLGLNFVTVAMSQANGVRMMVNGQTVMTDPRAIANPFPVGTFNWVVGGNGSGSFNGAIDEVAHYGNEQTLDQHRARYRAGLRDRGIAAGLLLPV
jgi:hypothetical protein